MSAVFGEPVVGDLDRLARFFDIVLPGVVAKPLYARAAVAQRGTRARGLHVMHFPGRPGAR